MRNEGKENGERVEDGQEEAKGPSLTPQRPWLVSGADTFFLQEEECKKQRGEGYWSPKFGDTDMNVMASLGWYKCIL